MAKAFDISKFRKSITKSIEGLSIGFNDQTHTMRYAVAYALNKTDAVAVKYDRVQGDSNQKVVSVAYTVGF